MSRVGAGGGALGVYSRVPTSSWSLCYLCVVER